MIGQIDIEKTLQLQPNKECLFVSVATILNHVVDAVNELQTQVAILEEHAHPTATTEPADPYAEQQKWIGKLCKFYDYDDDEKWFSKLEYIDKNSPYPYCASGDWWYKHCEPVKPDDDIIYKGGDNE